MHILLTDVLACPRCGPDFGLILLADRVESRRVPSGRLGCANCREQYPIVGGVADLRTAAASSNGDTSPTMSSAEEATRIAALLGVTQPGTYVALAGDAAQHAVDASAQLDDVEVIAVSHRPMDIVDARGVSVVLAEGMPFAAGRMGGVAVTGRAADALLDAAARAVRPTGRLLVDPAPVNAEERLRAAGLRVLAREGDTLLAVRG